ncbi:MAG TPA: FAD synthetase family protein [Candidatus Limnocylindrales bacterium]
MIVVQGVDALEATVGRLFVVVGVFDGLHRGHQYLLRRLVQGARSRAARPAVVTFDHHPDEILVGAAPPLLCDPAERLDRLAAAGVEVTIVQHFDEALRHTPYDTFIDRIRAHAELAGFLMTPDAAFGHERRGTPATVAAYGAQVGYDVEVVPPFTLDGRPVRSTEIRSAIAAGDLAAARKLLGRAVAVVGEASTAGAGEGRSRVTFALPVALPPDGRYPVGVAVGGRRPIRAAAEVSTVELTLDVPVEGRARITFA